MVHPLCIQMYGADKGCRLQSSLCLWAWHQKSSVVSVLSAYPSCCHQAKQSSFPTASPLAWLAASCQPGCLVSTSVSTPLLFHSRMFSSFLPLSPSTSVSLLSPSLPPLWWYMLLSPWNTGLEPNKPSLLMATSSVLRTLLDNSSTSVYRPIGALVCKPDKGRVARLSNMAPFYLWSLYLLYCVGNWTL